mgnify:CR=1 FL=1
MSHLVSLFICLSEFWLPCHFSLDILQLCLQFLSFFDLSGEDLHLIVMQIAALFYAAFCPLMIEVDVSADRFL